MERTNLQAVTSYCRLIASGFEPLEDVVLQTLYDAHMDPCAVAQSKDNDVIICALHIVRGLCESARSENSASVSIDIDQVKSNIKWYCKKYHLNPLDYMDDSAYGNIVRNGSKLW